MTWRPRGGFRVGKMRERVTIESAALSVDSAGQEIKTWSTLLSDEPASFEPAAGSETIRGRQLEDGVNAIFLVRYRSGYSPKQRVIFGSDTYGIVHVKRVQGGYRYLELHCKAVSLADTAEV